MLELNIDQFTERAAICEFDGNMTRFAAETAAATEQGMSRWQAIAQVREAQSADGIGNPAATRDHRAGHAGQSANDVSVVQSRPEEENRPVPERGVQA